MLCTEEDFGANITAQPLQGGSFEQLNACRSSLSPRISLTEPELDAPTGRVQG